MRSIDSALLARILAKIQTQQANNRPRMRIQAVRPRTALASNAFLSETIVATASATDVSVAARKRGTDLEMIYCAYVAGGTLTIKSAVPAIPSSLMTWSTVETISGVTSASLAFDGDFVRADFSNVDYHTDDLPTLAYITSSGIYCGVLGGPYDLVVAGIFASLDIVRGVADAHKSIDQGMLLFYIQSGLLYYKQRIDGIWSDPIQVTIAPSDLTDVHAMRTFDYRIILQVQTSAGAVHEIVTKMEASGWALTEEILVSNLTATVSRIPVNYTSYQATEAIGVSSLTALVERIAVLVAPEIVSVSNIDDGTGPWDTIVQMVYNGDVNSVTDNLSAYSLTDGIGGSWNPTAITAVDSQTYNLTFPSFDYSDGDMILHYTPGTVSNSAGSAPAQDFEWTATNLSLKGTMTESIAVSGLTATVERIAVTYSSGQMTESIAVSGLTATVERIDASTIIT